MIKVMSSINLSKLVTDIIFKIYLLNKIFNSHLNSKIMYYNATLQFSLCFASGDEDIYIYINVCVFLIM